MSHRRCVTAPPHPTYRPPSRSIPAKCGAERGRSRNSRWVSLKAQARGWAAKRTDGDPAAFGRVGEGTKHTRNNLWSRAILPITHARVRHTGNATMGTIVTSGIIITSGATSGLIVDAGGVVTVESGATTVSSVLSGGGSEVLSGGAIASNTTIETSGSFVVSSRASAFDTINNGGSAAVSSGGTEL